MGDGLPKLTSALADRYRVERQLGRGGMATVYLAEARRKLVARVPEPLGHGAEDHAGEGRRRGRRVEGYHYAVTSNPMRRHSGLSWSL